MTSESIKRFCIVGLGRSGVSLARYLYTYRAPRQDPKHTDSNSTPETIDLNSAAQSVGLGNTIFNLFPFDLMSEHAAHPHAHNTHLVSVEFVVWDDCEEKRMAAQKEGWSIWNKDFDWTDAACIVSPGVADHPIMQHALEHNRPIMCDIQLFHTFFPHVQKIGVTGSNGKTTTCALIHHGLKKHNRSCVLAGNMGIPIFSTLRNGFPADAIYILELSSYQLELCDYLTLDVAIILNLFPHHLERHGTMDRYRAIKETILQGARIGWVPKDWPTNGNTHWDDCTQPLISGQQVFQGSVQRWSSDCVQDYDLPKCLSGTHNRENVAATVAVLRALQCTKTDIFQDFTGLEHRQEWVAHANGIGYCNDSKATNPHAVVKAIQAYSSHPIFWIAGGVLQNDDLDVLDSCVQSVAHGFMIGQAGPRYAQWLQDRGKSATLCSSLQDAVHRAHALAVSAVYDGCVGITILLSPGCASFDEFRDFEHRGHVFKQCVWKCLGQSDLSEPSYILSGSIS